MITKSPLVLVSLILMITITINAQSIPRIKYELDPISFGVQQLSTANNKVYQPISIAAVPNAKAQDFWVLERQVKDGNVDQSSGSESGGPQPNIFVAGHRLIQYQCGSNVKIATYDLPMVPENDIQRQNGVFNRTHFMEDPSSIQISQDGTLFLGASPNELLQTPYMQFTYRFYTTKIDTSLTWQNWTLHEMSLTGYTVINGPVDGLPTLKAFAGFDTFQVNPLSKDVYVLASQEQNTMDNNGGQLTRLLFNGIVVLRADTNYKTGAEFLNVARNATALRMPKLSYESVANTASLKGALMRVGAFRIDFMQNVTYAAVNVLKSNLKSIAANHITKFDMTRHGVEVWSSKRGAVPVSTFQLRLTSFGDILYLNDRVKNTFSWVFTSESNFTVIGTFGSFGVQPEEFFEPRSFFIDDTRALLIADTGNSVVKKFSPDCQTGYYGFLCDQTCPGGATNPCNNRGECGKFSGKCLCNDGFFGTSCEKVSPVQVGTVSPITIKNVPGVVNGVSATPFASYNPSIQVMGNGNYLIQTYINGTDCVSQVPDNNGPFGSSDPSADAPVFGPFQVGDTFQLTVTCAKSNITLSEITPTGEFVRNHQPAGNVYVAYGNGVFAPLMQDRVRIHPTTGDIFFVGLPYNTLDDEKSNKIYQMNNSTNQIIRTYNTACTAVSQEKHDVIGEIELDVKNNRLGIVCAEVTVPGTFFSPLSPSPQYKTIAMLNIANGASAGTITVSKNITSFTFSEQTGDLYVMAYDTDNTELRKYTATSNFATSTLISPAIPDALGATRGAYREPGSMLVTPDDLLVIYDKGNKRLQFINATSAVFILTRDIPIPEDGQMTKTRHAMAFDRNSFTLVFTIENTDFTALTTKQFFKLDMPCTTGYWGPKCVPCADTVCGGRGSCDSGRKNTGKCICAPANLYSGADCTTCTRGNFKPTQGTNTCVQCQPPNIVDTNGACIPCNAGSFFDGQFACQACEAGKMAPNPGASECTPCPVGNFNNVTGATSCSPCPKGTYQSTPGSRVCIECQEGRVAPNTGVSQCTPCVTSKTNDKSRTSCVCRPLFFQKDKDSPDCASCPEFLPRAVCLGGDDIRPRQGFWSAFQGSTVIYDCAGQRGCFSNTFGTVGTNCSEPGYTGPKCSVCLPGYQKEGVRCTKCEEDGSSEALIVVIILAMVIGITLLFRQKGGKGSILKVKILVGFLQMINQFTDTYDVAWPDSFKRLSNTLSFVNFNVVSISSFDCANGKPLTFYAGLEFYFALPLIFLPVMLVGWFIMDRIKRIAKKSPEELESFKSQCVKNASVVLLFLYPGIAQKMLQTFKCVEVEGVWYLEFDYREECFTERHNGYVGMAVMGLLMYVVGIPAAFILMLRKYKNELNTQVVRERFGFLYIGYSTKTYYWEIVEMVRKLVIASVLVFVARGLPSQLVVGMLVNLIALLLHERWQPYEQKSDHDLQYNALLQLFMTLFAGLLLKVEISKEPNDIILFGVLLVLINVAVVFMAIAQVLLQFKKKYDRVMAGDPSLKEKGTMWAKLVKVLGAQAVGAMGDDDEEVEDNEGNTTVIEMDQFKVTKNEDVEEEEDDDDPEDDIPEDEFEDKIKKSKRKIPENETEEEKKAREAKWAEEDRMLKEQEQEEGLDD